MIAEYMDLHHYYSPWYSTQPIGEISESHFVSFVEVLELDHPWHRNRCWKMVAESCHIDGLDWSLAMESCCSAYVMTMEFHMAYFIAEPTVANFGPCMDLCSSDLERFQCSWQIYRSINHRLSFSSQLLGPGQLEMELLDDFTTYSSSNLN